MHKWVTELENFEDDLKILIRMFQWLMVFSVRTIEDRRIRHSATAIFSKPIPPDPTIKAEIFSTP